MTTHPSNKPKEQIDSIIALFSSGQIQNALDSAENLIKDYPDNPVIFNIGGACHAALGEFEEAIRKYKKSLAIKPNYAEAHNNLGATLQELGQLDNAASCYKKAIQIKSGYAEAHNNLGNTLKELNQIDSAINSYKKATEINPHYAEAHYALGVIFQDLNQLEEAVKSFEVVLLIKPELAEMHNNIGVILQELGQVDKSLKHFKLALKIEPNFHEAHNNLGNILKGLNHIDSAIKSYKCAISIKPDYVEANHSLGIIYQDLNQFIKANNYFNKVIKIKPDFADVYFNLGSSLQSLDQLSEAIKSYEKALNINPEFTEAYNNLGIALMSLGQLDSAIKNYEKAISIHPKNAEAHLNLGLAYQKLGQLDDSVECYKKSLSAKPDYAEAHNNLGITLMDLGQLTNADESFEKAISINPEYYLAYSNRGNLLTSQKRFDEALLCYQRAIDIEPYKDFILGNFIHTKMHLCMWSELSTFIELLIKKINSNQKIIKPFALLALIDDPEIQKKATEIYANERHTKIQDLSKFKKVLKHKKIRIGYFSADFREHPVANLTAELYERHNRKEFEIYAFSFGPNTNDEMNLRIKAGVDNFYDVHSMSHIDVVKLSRSMEIDIAVDLGGYTQNSRTEIFAMQAASIQVNYLGYSGTMGVDYMDYLIADHTLIPKNKQSYYSEKIAYLPYSFMVNDTKNKTSKRVFTRAEIGLPLNGFIFCCFNNHYKITPGVFASWMRILSKVDGSVLWLAKGNDIAQNNLIFEAKKHNIDESRIIFASRLNLREEHLNRIQIAGLFLDTMPYNAHATTSDALQVNLPVLTCIGNSFASRVAASLINSVNLPELITSTKEQYESLAIQLATNPEQLNIIKEKLKNNLSKSPLYNTPLYTQHLESAYLAMYSKHKNGLDPDHIYVQA